MNAKRFAQKLALKMIASFPPNSIPVNAEVAAATATNVTNAIAGHYPHFFDEELPPPIPPVQVDEVPAAERNYAQTKRGHLVEALSVIAEAVDRRPSVSSEMNIRLETEALLVRIGQIARSTIGMPDAPGEPSEVEDEDGSYAHMHRETERQKIREFIANQKTGPLGSFSEVAENTLSILEKMIIDGDHLK